MIKNLTCLCGLLLVMSSCCGQLPVDYRATMEAQNYTSISEALCDYISENEEYRGGPIVVISKTKPLIDLFLLRSVYSPDTADLQAAKEDDSLSEALRESHPVDIITISDLSSECSFGLAEKPDPSNDGEILLLEYSGLVRNPFAGQNDPELGVFAKLRLQGQHTGSWFWVEVIIVERYLLAGRVMRLPIEDG